MTSANFYNKFYEASGLTKKQSHEVLMNIEEVVRNMVKNGEAFTLAGLNIKITDVPAHQGRNPATGESIMIPDKKRVIASPSSSLKESVNS